MEKIPRVLRKIISGTRKSVPSIVLRDFTFHANDFFFRATRFLQFRTRHTYSLLNSTVRRYMWYAVRTYVTYVLSCDL